LGYEKFENLREKWQDPQKYPPQQPIFFNKSPGFGFLAFETIEKD
jgi:hypothetical protein